jgi:hypothetical protein
VLTGPITAGDQCNWAFDLRPNDIQRVEISIRQFNEVAQFANIPLKPGHQTLARGLRSGYGGGNYFDDALYNKLFSRDLGESMQLGDIPAAAHAATELIAQLSSRRAHLQTENHPDAYLIDKALPIVIQVRDALEHNDLTTASALLQADTASGRCLQNALQRLAQDK